MANVEQYVNQIASAIYGREVRGSICQAILEMNEESTHAEEVAISSQSSALNSAEAAATSAIQAQAAIEQVEQFAKDAEDSKDAAALIEQNVNQKATEVSADAADARVSKDAAKVSEDAAKVSEGNALNQATLAAQSYAAAQQAAQDATTAKSQAQQSAQNAQTSATTAASAQTAAGISATNAQKSADDAKGYAEQAKAVAKIDVATDTTPGIVKPDNDTTEVDALGNMKVKGLKEHISDSMIRSLSNLDGVHGVRIYTDPTTNKTSLQKLDADTLNWVDVITAVTADGTTIQMLDDGTLKAVGEGRGYSELHIYTTESTLMNNTTLKATLKDNPEGLTEVVEGEMVDGYGSLKVYQMGTYEVSIRDSDGMWVQNIIVDAFGIYTTEIAKFRAVIPVKLDAGAAPEGEVTIFAKSSDGVTEFKTKTSGTSADLTINKPGTYSVYAMLGNAKSSTISNVDANTQGRKDTVNLAFAKVRIRVIHESSAYVTLTSSEGSATPYTAITKGQGTIEIFSSKDITWTCTYTIDGEAEDSKTIPVMFYGVMEDVVSASTASVRVTASCEVAPIMDHSKYVYDYSSYDKPKSIIETFSCQLYDIDSPSTPISDVTYFTDSVDGVSTVNIKVDTKTYTKSKALLKFVGDISNGFTVPSNTEVNIEAKKTTDVTGIEFVEKYAVLEVQKSDSELLDDDVKLTWDGGEITHTADGVTVKSKFIVKKAGIEYTATCNGISDSLPIHTLNNDDENPYSIALQTALYLYKEGNQYEEITNGWAVSHNLNPSLTGGIEFTSDSIYFKNRAYQITVSTKQSIPIPSNASKICFEIKAEASSAPLSYFYLNLTDEYPTAYYYQTKIETINSVRKVYELPITGGVEKYVSITGINNVYGNIYAIWIE